MKSLNQITLIGNVGKDPETRETQSGPVASFTLATSTGGFTKQDGTQVPEKTQWHNIVCFRSLATLAGYLHKGDRAVIIGQVTYHEYEKEGIKHRATDILATDLMLISSKEKSPNPSKEKDKVPDISSVQGDLPFQEDLPF